MNPQGAFKNEPSDKKKGTIVCCGLHTSIQIMTSVPSPARPDSSGFEHVFVGETRGGRTVIGFHNWIQLYLQEKLGHIDYKGYSVSANSPQVRCVITTRNGQ